ncbi:hypothetical protein Dimus_001326, partial [Dionaea muscipula]
MKTEEFCDFELTDSKACLPESKDPSLTTRSSCRHRLKNWRRLPARCPAPKKDAPQTTAARLTPILSDEGEIGKCPPLRSSAALMSISAAVTSEGNEVEEEKGWP